MAERILIGLIFFLVGSFCMLSTWDRAAQRGVFEIGGVVYKTEVVRP